MFNWLKQRDILAKLIFSYFIIFVIPFIIGIYTYTNAYRSAMNNLNQYSRMILTQLPSRLNDEIIKPLDTIAETIDTNPFYLTLLFNQDVLVNKMDMIIDVRNFINQLKVYSINPYILEVGIYLPDDDVVITSQFFESSRLYYDYITRPDKMSYDKWIGFLKGYYYRHFVPSMSFIIGNQKHDSILFVHTLSKWSFGNKNATLFVILDKEKLASFLQSNSFNEKSNIFITSSDNNILLNYKTDADIGQNILSALDLKSTKQNNISEFTYNSNKYMMFFTIDINGLKYIVLMSLKTFLKPLQGFKIYLILYFIISVILGIPAVIILVHRSYRPFFEIKNILFSRRKNNKSFDEEIKLNLPEKTHIKSESDLLKEMASLLVTEEKRLRESMSSFLPIYQNWFFEHLVMGKIDYPISENEIFDRFQIRFISDNFMVIIIEIYDCSQFSTNSNIPDYNLVRFIIFNIINEVLTEDGNLVFNIMLSDKQLAVMLNLTGEGYSIDKITEKIEFAKNFIQSNFSILLTIGISTVKKDLLQLPRCYKEAEKALNCKFISGHVRIYRYDHLSPQLIINDSVFMTPDIQNKIYDSILNGNYTMIEETFRLIRSDYVKDDIDSTDAKILCIQIYTIYENACKMVNAKPVKELKDYIENEIMENSNTITIHDYLNRVKEAFYDLCMRIEKNKLSFSSQMVEKITDYINANYSDANLSLVSIAEKFNITPQYLSSLFKEKTGQNISDYIIQLRVDRAKNLLLSTNYSVNEIAQKVGYAYSNSFIITFKKRTGMSPTKFRSIYKGA